MKNIIKYFVIELVVILLISNNSYAISNFDNRFSKRSIQIDPMETKIVNTNVLGVKHIDSDNKKQSEIITEIFNYNKVYNISLKEGFATTITINSYINSVALGDTNDFNIKQLTNNSIVVYPLKKVASTNLNIKDIDGFQYNFKIESFDKNNSIIPTLSITINRPLFNKESINNQHLSHNFAVFGVDWNGHDVARKSVESIIPNDVWTDGQYMYLDFRGHDTIPAVEQVIDGIDNPVSMNIKDGIMVVFGVKDLILIASGKVLCIKPD